MGRPKKIVETEKPAVAMTKKAEKEILRNAVQEMIKDDIQPKNFSVEFVGMFFNSKGQFPYLQFTVDADFGDYQITKDVTLPFAYSDLTK